MTPFDLRTYADDHRWAWRYEESFAAERPELREEEAPWLVEIVCKAGFIYPVGADRLAAWSDTRGTLLRLLKLDPRVRPHQTGDREGSVSFPVDLLGAVAKKLRPVREPSTPSWEARAEECLGLFRRKRRRAARKAGREA